MYGMCIGIYSVKRKTGIYISLSDSKCERSDDGESCKQCQAKHRNNDGICVETEEISNCTSYIEDKCKTCKDGYKNNGNECVELSIAGCTHYSGETCETYSKISRCTNQTGYVCNACETGYKTPDCTECESTYHKGEDGKCYANLTNGRCITYENNSSQCASCSGGFSGTSCTTCESNDVVGENCYTKITNQTCISQSGGVCTGCAPGYGYNSSAKTCTQCTAGTFSAGGTATCALCPSGQTSSVGTSSCKAAEGCQNSSCSSCKPGYGYAGSTGCVKCSAVTYGQGGQTSCKSCVFDLKGKPLGMSKQLKKTYFNDGVILMDLTKWREQKITHKLLTYYDNVIKTNPQNYAYPDQDLINIVLKNDIYFLPYRWNVFGSYNGKSIPDYMKFNKKNVKSIVSIFHYCGRLKPWNNLRVNVIGFNLYQSYWNHSVFVVMKPYYQWLSFKRHVGDIFHKTKRLCKKYRDILRYNIEYYWLKIRYWNFN